MKRYHGIDHVFTNRSGSDIIYLAAGPGEHLTIDAIGNLIIPGSTQESVSTTTGSLVLPGGIGIGKDVYSGGSLTMLSTSLTSLTILGSASVLSLSAGAGAPDIINKLTISGTTQSTSNTSGSLVVYGGLGAGTFTAGATTVNNLVLGDDLSSNNLTLTKSIQNGAMTASNIVINNTKDSTSIGSGSLVLTGNVTTGIISGSTFDAKGISSTLGNVTLPSGGSIITKDLWIGGNLSSSTASGHWQGDRVVGVFTYPTVSLDVNDGYHVLLHSTTPIYSTTGGYDASFNGKIYVNKTGSYFIQFKVKVVETDGNVGVGAQWRPSVLLWFNSNVDLERGFFQRAFCSSLDEEAYIYYCIKKLQAGDFMEILVTINNPEDIQPPWRMNFGGQLVITSVIFDNQGPYLY